MIKKRRSTLMMTLISIVQILLLAFPMKVFAKENVPAAIPFNLISDPLGVYHFSNQVKSTAKFSFSDYLNIFRTLSFTSPVQLGDCKTVNAECKINESGKDCCPGLSCVDFNPVSGNGKCAWDPCPSGQSRDANGVCQWNPCANGATNPPDCTSCPSGKELLNGSCVAACLPGQTRDAQGVCQWNPCANGATNPPDCTACPSGQELVNSSCVAACLPGQTRDAQGVCQWNPCPSGQTRDAQGVCQWDPCPSGQTRDAQGVCQWDPCPSGQTRDAIGVCQWDPCPSGQTRDVEGVCQVVLPAVCLNGASNFPDCSTCPGGQAMINGSCVAVCTDPLANNVGEPLPCTYQGAAPLLLPSSLIIPVTGFGAGTKDLITAGIGHSCAVTPRTGLRCWGLNDAGQLGHGNNKNSSVPVKVLSLEGRNILQLVSGSEHTCALLSSGDVFCWGSNLSGQLGDGTNVSRNVPVRVKGLSGKIESITAGQLYTCAVNSAGETKCWGNNSTGQFNNGNTSSSNVPVLASLEGIKTISGAWNDLQGITSRGGLTFFSNQPFIPVTGLTNNIVKVAGNRFAEGGCAMTSAGAVDCWGSISGSGITGGLLTKPLVSGEGHGCMITDKGLVCWGLNEYGQLGNGSLKNSDGAAVTVSGIKDAIDLAAGYGHTCAIDGLETIRCWGRNTYGQLGDGTNKDSSTPVKVK